MNQSVINALKSADDTRFMDVGVAIIPRIAEFFERCFADQKAIIICDKTTWDVAGKTISNIMRDAQLLDDCFIFDSHKPYAGWENVEKLDARLRTTDAVPVAVGSGTINDLTKLASAHNDRQYMCVPTAASVDGYTAYGASITHEGAKKTFFCPAPFAVFADVDIIRNAPPEMTAAGYADLFAKIPAGADWILADALDVEKIEPAPWSIVQDSLKDALADPEGISARKPAAVEALFDGLILSGFAMQCARSSRPASGAEHYFSHLWNMEHHTHNGEMPSHGFQVGVATLAVSQLYEKMLTEPMEMLDIDAAVSQWLSWDEQIALFRSMFTDDLLKMAIDQSKEKYIGRDELAVQLTTLRDNWQEIKHRLEHQLIPSQEVRRRLKAAGAPTDPQEIGITPARMRASYRRAQCLRSRFTILDVAVRTSLLDKWLSE
ncbi:MAG: sn-glycerol-1-phosphate dehydrogenase [Tannerella sp.]|jgi:glycerol-1-phosphate dehydrogenase [NAD(P)+]|nr:sn-glycerol-1-phosphate dehydrogenase [Tannerella sp.]